MPQMKAPKRAPLVQLSRGPIVSATYQALRQAQKKGHTIMYQGRRYRVALLTVELGMFEAQIVEVV
jgi:hypothetical protein